MKPTTLHMYLEYSLPVDLREVNILPDVDVSIAVGSRLVEIGREGQVVSGLSSHWKVDAKSNSVTFFLRPDSRWSDGSLLTPQDVIRSFEDTKKNFAVKIPSLFESYKKLEVSGPDSVRFTIRDGIQISLFLEKLSEPMHGIVKLADGKVSFEVTSGPYVVERADANALVLAVNPYWFSHHVDMYQRIELKRPEDRILSARTLADDPWPDLVNIPSLATKSDMEALPTGTSIWRRNQDRLFHLRYGGRCSLQQMRVLAGFIRAHSEFRALADQIDHATVAEQIYPKGLILHSQKSPSVPNISAEEMRKAWPFPSVKILYAANRISPEVIGALKKYICDQLPVPCEFEASRLGDFSKKVARREVDLVFGGVGVDSINFDGALSYYIELKPPYLPSDDSERGNFLQRLRQVRMSGVDPVQQYRKILFDAVDGNYIVPLFHSCSTYIARDFIDLSSVPQVYETVPFHYIFHFGTD